MIYKIYCANFFSLGGANIMTLVDIEQEMQFVYFDDKHKCWRQKTGTIAEFLQVYSAYQYIKVLDVNEVKWGALVEYGKKKRNKNIL